MSTAEQALRRAQQPHHPPRIVTDEDVDKALAFLRDSAKELGAAKQALMEKESLVKRTKALVMRMHSDKTLGAAEREAILDPRYEKAETEEAEAAGVFETLRALRDAASAKIECWRSEQATYRSMKL
jgi:beta-phosphoglucomutase-like phosphatase (HAD superfamily)